MPHRDGPNTLNSSQTELFATVVNGFLPLLQTSMLLGSNGGVPMPQFKKYKSSEFH